MVRTVSPLSRCTGALAFLGLWWGGTLPARAQAGPDAGVLGDDAAPAVEPDAAVAEPAPPVDISPAKAAEGVVGSETVAPTAEPVTTEPSVAADEDAKEYAGMSLGELLDIPVTAANRREERLSDAPAPIVVITAEDIEMRGYSDLAEVFMDLPGFDFSLFNGSDYLNAYQRGYRTPYTNRTLFLVNGQVDNTLWWQTAQIGRQYPLTNIARIEILYGPASVVYGPNAFLGVVNIVTKDGTDLEDGAVDARVRAGAGSWDTRFVDVALNTRRGDLTLSFSARLHRSDEPDLSGRGWGWLDNSRYSDIRIWGPLLDRTMAVDAAGMPVLGPDGRPQFVAGLHPGEGAKLLPGVRHHDVPLGRYYDPTDDYGMLGMLKLHGLTIGFIRWQIQEGYGGQYAGDQAQATPYWSKNSQQIYGQYEAHPVEDVTSTTLLLFRQSRYFGDWAEAYPDSSDPSGLASYVSYSLWNSDSNSILFRQIVDYSLLDGDLVLTAGVSFERKDLTKNYDISGYYAESFSSVEDAADGGAVGWGPGVVHSDSTVAYDVHQAPPEHSPTVNRVLTTDQGGFAAANWKIGQFRLTGGVRYDHNSIYGDSVNPRVAFIYRLLGERAAIKLIFGTAFQEPPAGLLFGGWNGRAPNPGLEPERAYNGDLIFMMQMGRFLGDVSLFAAHYTDVILEEGANTGTRDAYGGELKTRFRVPNFFSELADIHLWANVSVTFSTSSVKYDFANVDPAKNFIDADGTTVGDIAPLKLHFGTTLPLPKGGWLTLRGNFVSERTLYLRNALRDPARPDGGRELDGYVTIDTFLGARVGGMRLGFLVKNLLDADYMYPGVEQADSGDTFTNARSSGFRNSLVPAAERSFMLTLGMDL